MPGGVTMRTWQERYFVGNNEELNVSITSGLTWLLNTYKNDTAKSFELITHNISDPIIIFDDETNIIYRNPAYRELPGFVRSWTTANVLEVLSGIVTKVPSWPYSITVVKNKDCNALVLKNLRMMPNIGESLFNTFKQEVLSGFDVYKTATRLLSQFLGWRYVAITEFVTPFEVKFLSFWDTTCWVKVDNYCIQNTPCELASQTSRVTFLTNVQNTFPEAELLAELGVESYASLIYRDNNNKPIGQIVLLHDTDDINLKQAEQGISMISMALNTVEKNIYRESKSKHQEFYQHMQKVPDLIIFQQHLKHMNGCLDKDYQLIISNLVRINDNVNEVTEAPSEQFQCMLINELQKIGGSRDIIFRLGNQQLALISEQSSQRYLNNIRTRLQSALQRINIVLDDNVQLEVGAARLAEFKGDTHLWLKKAEHRSTETKTLSSLQRRSLDIKGTL